MKSLVCRIIPLLLSTTALQYTAKEIRQLMLFTKSTTWNHAQELCESVGMKLVTVDSEDVPTAIEVFEDLGAWTGVGDFWMGLHEYNESNPNDYLWVDCRPFVPQSWTSWKDELKVDRRCARTRDDGDWEMKSCDQEHGKPVCQNITQGDCSFVDYSDHSFDLSDNPPVNLTTRNMYSFHDCESECLNHTSFLWPCWGFEHESHTCSLYNSETMTNVYNILKKTTGKTAHIRLCYIGIRNETDFDVKYKGTQNETPWKGCNASLSVTAEIPSPTTTKYLTSTPLTTEPTTSTPPTKEPTTSTPPTTHPRTLALSTTDSPTEVATTTLQKGKTTTSVPYASHDKATTTTELSLTTSTAAASTAELSPSTGNGEETTNGSQTNAPTASESTSELAETATTIASRTGETDMEHPTTPTAILESISVTSGISKPDVEVCLCMCRNHPNLTVVEKEEIIEGILNNLTIDTRTISSTRRKYESVYDPRPSAQALGGAGVAILAFALGLLFLLDITALWRDLGRLWSRLNRK